MPENDTMSKERPSSIDATMSLGKPVKLPGAEESFREAQDFPQPEFKSELYDIRMQLGGEEDEAEKDKQAAENRYGQEREEEYAKRDRVLGRIVNARNPEDIAAALEVLSDYEGVHFGETIDRFMYGAYKKAALEGQRAFEKTTKDLEREGIVKGKINKDGYLDKDGVVIHNGYSMGVESSIIKFKDTKIIPKTEYEVDEKTGEKKKIKYTEEVIEETREARVEKIKFGTDVERKAMAKAYEALHQSLVVSELLQNQTILFDETRASLESMVKYFYQKQLYFTNLQTKWFFSAPDISKISPENPASLENKEMGEKRDKAMRLQFLIGMCETREKMEKHLNETFNLEEILDKETVAKVVEIAKARKWGDVDPLTGKVPETDQDRFDYAARFLIGKNLQINRDNGTGHTIYKLDKWLTLDERDPSKVRKPKAGDANDEFRYFNEVKNYGQGSIGRKGNTTMKGEIGERGFLTELGNPYAEDSRDNLYMLMSEISMIVGDDRAVSEAGRYFWTRGMRDELGLELYTDEKNFPTGEQLLHVVNTFTDEDRAAYFSGLQKLVVLNGEPAGSDLSKLIHTKWWRFKEMIRDRSAGPYLTWDKFDHMSLSLLSLCRTEIKSGEIRSIEEQWMGYKSSDGKSDEKAVDLGDIEWEKVRVSPNVSKSVGMEEKGAIPKSGGISFKVDGEALRDNADGYYWVMHYLAGDDNQAKRPYQFIMKGIERPNEMQKPEAYTDKIKFWSIIWHDAVVIGGKWRELYSEFRDKGPKFAEYMASKRASVAVNKGKKDWYDGIRSGVDYTSWQVATVEFFNYDLNLVKKLNLKQYVEGTSGSPGPAVKYGFMSADKIGKPPEHFVKLPRG